MVTSRPATTSQFNGQGTYSQAAYTFTCPLPPLLVEKRILITMTRIWCKPGVALLVVHGLLPWPFDQKAQRGRIQLDPVQALTAGDPLGSRILEKPAQIRPVTVRDDPVRDTTCL